jgi:hypothetical protein
MFIRAEYSCGIKLVHGGLWVKYALSWVKYALSWAMYELSWVKYELSWVKYERDKSYPQGTNPDGVPAQIAEVLEFVVGEVRFRQKRRDKNSHSDACGSATVSMAAISAVFGASFR